jgi:hypothetical protein
MLIEAGVGSEGHNVCNEKYDSHQTLDGTSEVNVNVETVTHDENSLLKSCDAVQQLPSSENFAQNVSSDVKEEQKSSPVLGSLPRIHTDDVFLPITTNEVKEFTLL